LELTTKKKISGDIPIVILLKHEKHPSEKKITWYTLLPTRKKTITDYDFGF